ncbi:MAG: hypothetical protein H6721_08610 [Sandaracinus sp.]|nr:hypothetical protein [Sandaracinus sp.]MCB9613335.1 hypothetical protein [Sandaracinus sp.]MCB9632178.1 hypothetical protein [Sandaracinus sp.]
MRGGHAGVMGGASGGGCGCVAAGSRSEGAAWLVLVGLVGIELRRRSRRR